MKTKKIEVDGKQIEVRELLTEQIETLFADGAAAINAIADAVVGRIPGTKRLLALCTPLTEEQIGKLGVNGYARLVTAMKEINADFFEMYRRDLTDLGRLVAEIPSAPPGSSATPEPSTGS